MKYKGWIKTHKKLSVSVLAVFVSILIWIIWQPPSWYEVLETAKAERSSLENVVVQTGIIKPQVGAVVKIGARTTGEIISMYARVGREVKKGELIAKIDDRDTKKEIEELQMNIAKVQATLTKLRESYPQKMNEANDDFKQKRAKSDLAKLQYERQEALLEKGYIAKNDYDRAKSEFIQADLDAAKSSDTRKRTKIECVGDIKVAEGDLALLKHSLQRAEIRLSYTNIISPIDGVVTEVSGQEGETVVTGLQVANLVTVLSPGKLDMWIYVDETDIGRIRKGLEAEFTVDTYPDKTFKGTIDRIDPQPLVKDNIVYFQAIVMLPKETATLLRPEMTTHVKIVTETKQNVLTVPNGSVKYEDGKYVVYLVKTGGAIEKADVKIGIRGQQKTEVLSGLKDSDVVASKLIIKKRPKKRK
ncbi:MAG: efflux RND transporter periplasmic adaptor subunit [Nitrospirae bacterium]|nr:efflux RND transporter periplasmic adaptor subunit [Nitrospirota bacterium]MBF0534424.1 efflux RND transporter periplasmic adaptor subunit [Nitrospirota bacterium]MBF0615595.1 efflux RND transporter periplasmic adaptor subunit [Nitrospirota bacterium]